MVCVGGDVLEGCGVAYSYGAGVERGLFHVDVTLSEAIDVLSGLGRAENKFVWAESEDGTVLFMLQLDVER